MATPVKCPKGHWFNPEVFGNCCPVCKARDGRSGQPLSEDDVLAILDTPAEAAAEQPSDAEKDAARRFVAQAQEVLPRLRMRNLLLVRALSSLWRSVGSRIHQSDVK